ncbi:hypothetical protein KSX_78880 [Ktedonospora formicarum]|uniref:Uncharacterized protein n=1 Tax=Ktedonospora formicarum TaxID=2778364 RepID=A0A8J3IAE9_9CHLR|nr:hypothetical protein KSX_78880 [Ktedonospora formicarum]
MLCVLHHPTDFTEGEVAMPMRDLENAIRKMKAKFQQARDAARETGDTALADALDGLLGALDELLNVLQPSTAREAIGDKLREAREKLLAVTELMLQMNGPDIPAILHEPLGDAVNRWARVHRDALTWT